MTDKRWKAVERAYAKSINGRRIPVTGEREGIDVESDTVALQIKSRRSRPGYLTRWLDGIVRQAERAQKVGAVVWHEPGEPYEQGVVLMRYSDWVESVSKNLTSRSPNDIK